MTVRFTTPRTIAEIAAAMGGRLLEDARVVRRKPGVCSACLHLIEPGETVMRVTTLEPFFHAVLCDGCTTWEWQGGSKRRRGGGATGPISKHGKARCRAALLYGSADAVGRSAA